MEILIKAGQLVLSLSILIILHEFGHFTFAKIFKTRVEKFYLFFDPWFSLFKIKKGETEYGIGWLPLGGYVKISGMIDESMDKEQMKQPPQPWEFRSKPSWQRLLIMVGGVLVNFLLALVLYSMVLYIWGEQYLPVQNAKYGIMCDSLALRAGLQQGDKILTIDGKVPEGFHTIVPDLVLDKKRDLEVERNGQVMHVTIPETMIAALIKDHGFITPRFPFVVDDFTKDSEAKKAGFEKGDKIVKINNAPVEFFDQFKSEILKYKNKSVSVGLLRGNDTITSTLNVPASGLIGVYPVSSLEAFFKLKQINYGFFESIPAGISKGFQTISNYLKQFRLLFNPETKAYESLGGFISIGKIFPSVWDWEAFWNLTAFLSIILAVMNILPIPALDGGHVIFLLYEIVTGRKPGDKFLEYAQIAGMILLLSLLIFVNANDIIKLFK